MQVDSENLFDNSNNPHLLENRYPVRSRRRKIYDDGDFKEVVKNFYALISEINKIANKKIQKAAPLKNKQQTNVQNKKPLQKKLQSQDLKKTDLYNFKKEPIYSQVAYQAQPYYNHQQYQQFSQNYMNPFYNTTPTQLQIISRNQLNNPQLKRNSYHIAISYFIYIQSNGQEQYESRDPTMNAKRKMKETNSDGIKVQLSKIYCYFQQLDIVIYKINQLSFQIINLKIIIQLFSLIIILIIQIQQENHKIFYYKSVILL